MVVLAGIATATLATAPTAQADDIAYLVNVTVRPGYNFPNAEAALAYGHGLCDDVARGVPYRQLIARIKSDFNTQDEFQASYLVSQAVEELCEAQIWNLRQSVNR
jgi:hypothetical protein